ncbi:MAG TPA: hypothetical protein VG797_11625, partial [Phycisphaerales bacterium]|nr:hypothetical protein [Phycisphaerales bacterium]
DELDLSRLARVGTARLLDAETDVRVRADPRSVAASYNEKMSEHLGALRAGMVGLGGRYVLCPTSGDPVASLRALLTRRGPAS